MLITPHNVSGWRNRQTRTFEGRMGFPVRVRFPLPTPFYFTQLTCTEAELLVQTLLTKSYRDKGYDEDE